MRRLVFAVAVVGLLGWWGLGVWFWFSAAARQSWTPVRATVLESGEREPGAEEPRRVGAIGSPGWRIGAPVLAVLLHILLADAAVETFLSGSPLRWIVSGTVAAYVVLSILLWRRLGWEARSTLSLLVFLGLLAVTAWLPQGFSQGVILLRQPTSTVLAAVSTLAVLLSGAILLRAKPIPNPARAAVALFVVYAVAALATGILSGTPYPDLFHGRNLWGRLPFWLQGPFIGAAVLMTTALLSQIITGILRIRRAELRSWGAQVLALSMSLVMAASGLTVPPGPAPSTAERSTQTPPAAQQPQPIASPEAQQPSKQGESVGQSRQQIIARLTAYRRDPWEFAGLDAADRSRPIGRCADAEPLQNCPKSRSRCSSCRRGYVTADASGFGRGARRASARDGSGEVHSAMV